MKFGTNINNLKSNLQNKFQNFMDFVNLDFKILNKNIMGRLTELEPSEPAILYANFKNFRN
jgi:hypothetical protein